MNIQKPKALTSKSTAELHAILQDESLLSVEAAYEIAISVIEAEFDERPAPIRRENIMACMQDWAVARGLIA